MTQKEEPKEREIYIPVSGKQIQTQVGGDYTGRCYKCGSTNLWDDNSAYGCNDCGMIRFTG